jgi:hypothetical protein
VERIDVHVFFFSPNSMVDKAVDQVTF